jgi:polyisoprenoid-binding protein YceI
LIAEREKKEMEMKIKFTKFGLALGLTMIAALQVPAAPTTWQIDPKHSSAQFSVKHLMISTVRGEFHGLDGVIYFDDNDISKSTVNVTIDANSVDTREPDRDKHLKSPDFFDTAKYPTITFKSTKVEQISADKLKVTGDLTIHGVTRSVVLDVERPTAAIKDPWGMQRSAVSATTRINRQDFGVKWNQTLDSGGAAVSDDVKITIDVEMVIPPPAQK